MRILKYFILALFVCSVFSCVSVSTKSPQFISGDMDPYNLWFKENNWLMLQSEKRAFEEAKTDEEKEELIERFWEARDPDTFTMKNEFRLSYEQNLIEVRKDYSAPDDARRNIYLLCGKPDSKPRFASETLSSTSPFAIRVYVSEGEIWNYTSQGQNFQVIFAKLDPYKLQRAKDRYVEAEQEFSPVSFLSSKFETLYIGPIRYINISGFIEDFFQGGFCLQVTSETINDLKKPILNRAKNFYERVMPKVKREKYSHTWERGDIRVLIHSFEINSPEEAGIGIWLSFDKDTLKFEKKHYLANLSLFCEIRDSNNKQIVYYQEDSIEYKLKTKKDYYYHFWGSVGLGKYRVILEIAENIGKRHGKYEANTQTFDWSTPVLKADLLIGKVIEDSNDRFQGKPSYFSLKEGNFCPIFGNLYKDEFIFKEDDEMIIIFDVAGFQKDNYGNSSVEIFPSFTKGEQGARFYRGQLLEKVDSPFRGVLKLKIRDLIEDKKLKLSSGLYKVGLLIRDRIAGREGTKEFFHPIQIEITEKKQ